MPFGDIFELIFSLGSIFLACYSFYLLLKWETDEDDEFDEKILIIPLVVWALTIIVTSLQGEKWLGAQLPGLMYWGLYLSEKKRRYRARNNKYRPLKKAQSSRRAPKTPSQAPPETQRDPLDQQIEKVMSLEERLERGTVLNLLREVRQNAQYLKENDPHDQYLFKVRVTADLKAVENLVLEYLPASKSTKPSSEERKRAVKGLTACNKSLNEKIVKLRTYRGFAMDGQISILDGTIYDPLGIGELDK